MGRKRKHRDRNDDSEWLLKKLTRELRKRRRRSYSSSSSAEEEYYESEIDNPINNYQDSDMEGEKEPFPGVSHTPIEAIERLTSSEEDKLTAQPSTSGAVAIDNDNNDQHVEPPSSCLISEHLDDEILTILGDAPNVEAVLGKNIHADIAARLLHVLQNGLKKDHKDKIIEEYPIPGNCLLFKAPTLNPEVKAAVSEILQKKDASLAARQGQLGVVLSALASVMDILVQEKSDKNQLLLKHISNACRLLCDSHYIDTKLRRNFLISTLNNKLKDTLKESKRDKHLFGESLSEDLKANKAITKSSQDLKSYVTKPKMTAKNNKDNSTNNNLNWKRPQSNPQNPNRKRISTAQRTAGHSSTSHRNETTRKNSSRAHRSSAHYKNPRRH